MYFHYKHPSGIKSRILLSHNQSQFNLFWLHKKFGNFPNLQAPNHRMLNCSRVSFELALINNVKLLSCRANQLKLLNLRSTCQILASHSIYSLKGQAPYSLGAFRWVQPQTSMTSLRPLVSRSSPTWAESHLGPAWWVRFSRPMRPHRTRRFLPIAKGMASHPKIQIAKGVAITPLPLFSKKKINLIKYIF